MPSIVTDDFRVKNAADFAAQFSEDNIYLSIGKIHPWSDENSPDLPVGTIENIQSLYWDDIIGLKKATPTDVVHMVDRIDWTSGTVYDQYDPTDVNYYEGDFYVLTDDFNVYKCITNNGGAQSTTKPASTSASIFQTADGYEWKYMYTISTADATKFLTPNFMPVRNNATNVDSDGPGATPYPAGGHGSDNIRELNANFAGVTVALEFDESGKLATDNDFRAIALISNPYLFGTTTAATGVVYRQTTKLTLSGVTGVFTPDEEITSGANTADVVEFDDVNGILYVVVTNGSFSNGLNITGGSSGATATVDSKEDPELEPNSGYMLYVEHRKAQVRASDQTETITVILEF